MNALKQQQTNFARFTAGPLYYFKLLGIDLSSKQTNFNKVLQIFIIILFQQTAFIACTDASIADIFVTVGFMNYYTVGLGKTLSLVYNREALVKNHSDLHTFCPSIKVQREYKLEHYLKVYLRVENILSNFFTIIFTLYTLYPIVQTFYELWYDGEYSYGMSLLLWHPIPLKESVLEYIISYIIVVISSFSDGIATLGTDLCLFSSVSQLCLNLDLLAERILELDPKKPESLGKLKELIERHQGILRLADDINRIFAPTIIFSLMSSSFILCFNAYQLLDDVSFIFVIKTLILLCYEMKQSSRIFDVVYAHEWFNGSMEYRRLVLFMLIATRRPVTLNVESIADVSLITLKQVLSVSYQTFTVLKTA